MMIKRYFKKNAGSKRYQVLAVGVLALISVVFWPSGPAFAALAFDHNLTSSPFTANSAQSTWPVNTSIAASANSKIVLLVSWWTDLNNSGLPPTVVTASGGSLTWHTDIIATNNNGDGISIISADAPSGLASNTTLNVTLNQTQAGGEELSAMSFTGVATGTTTEPTNSNNSNVSLSQHWTSGAITTTNANDLLVGFNVCDDGISPCGSGSYTPDTNWTEVHDFNEVTSAASYESVYRIVSSTGSYTAGGTTTQGVTTAPDYVGAIVAYKAAGSNSTAAAPTLIAPTSSATNISVTPQFQLRTTDADNDYLRYEVQICSTSNCSSVVRTVCQDSNLPNSCTGSQTGWSGQNQQASTAYTGNSSIGSSTIATYTYQTPALSANTQYWWRAYAIDPGGTNTASSASSINTFTTSQTPAAPTLISPSASATGVSITPQFTLRSTDADNDDLQYRVYLYQSDCSTAVGASPFNQNGSQTGWSGQDKQSGTAYTGSSTLTSSTIATYSYQSALALNTVYCWKADAVDPTGSNTFSSTSATRTFTTTSTIPAVQINGGTTINGGSTIQ